MASLFDKKVFQMVSMGKDTAQIACSAPWGAFQEVLGSRLYDGAENVVLGIQVFFVKAGLHWNQK